MPIHKTDKETGSENCSPISLISYQAKVMEKVVPQEHNSFLEKNELTPEFNVVSEKQYVRVTYNTNI